MNKTLKILNERIGEKTLAALTKDACNLSQDNNCPYVGHCDECAFYLDYKDDWQCNGGSLSEECKCHPEILKENL